MPAFEYKQAEEIKESLKRHGVRYLFIGKSGAILSLFRAYERFEIIGWKKGKVASRLHARILSWRTTDDH